jgi:hypothetical protein
MEEVELFLKRKGRCKGGGRKGGNFGARAVVGNEQRRVASGENDGWVSLVGGGVGANGG